ncbi:MAG: hypothetical protein RIB60_00645 [Phycisphaerales bacterium]
MKIKQQTGDRLVLAGVPGSVAWMIFATILGAALLGILGTVAYQMFVANGFVAPHIALAVGIVIGGVIFVMGVVTLAVGRLRLELDLVTQKGSYKVTSPIVDAGKPCEFELKHVNSVSLERFVESRSHGASGPETGTGTAQIVRARLRVSKPRRAIVLDETENGQDERVERVATTVAEFLGLDVTKTSC